MSSQPTWITPGINVVPNANGEYNLGNSYPEGQPLNIQFEAIPSDQSSGQLANILLGQLKTITIANGGSGYVTAPAVTVTNAPGDTVGQGAQLIARVDQTTGKVSDLVIESFGQNYNFPPIITIAPPTTGSITSITVDTPGSGYTERPSVTFSANTGLGATAITNINANVASIYVSNGGGNYEVAPAIDITGGDNKIKAAGITTISAFVDYIEVLSNNAYPTPPVVVVAGGDGAGAAAQAVLNDLGFLTAIIITNAGSGYSKEPTVLVDGQEDIARAHISGFVNNYIVTRQGTQYTSSPTITISGGGGTGATAVAVIGDGQVQSILPSSSGGSGYRQAPFITFTGGGVNTASAAATIIGNISAISVTSIGSGYTQANTSITFTGGSGSGAVASPVINEAGELVSVIITNAGTNYTSEPTVNIVSSDPGASGAAARVRLSARINTITIPSRGADYKSKPQATAIDGFGSGAILTPVIDAVVTSIDVITAGTGYLQSPLPTINIVPVANAIGGTTAPFVGSGATATAVVTSVTATAIATINRGVGYSTTPKVIITRAPGDITGNGATAVAYIASNNVSAIQIINPGAGYTLNPIITVQDPVPLVKLTTANTSNSNVLTLNNTINLGLGMTTVINDVTYTVLAVNSPNVTINGNVTLISGSIVTLNGITATPTSTIEASPVTYKLQSGSLPLGISSNPVRLTTTGRLVGIPKEVTEVTTSQFTLRATDSLGNIRDRVFTMGIQGSDVPKFLTTPNSTLMSINDSTWVEYQVLYTTPDPVDVFITIDNGILPPGLYISDTGLITGYATPPVDIFQQPIIQTTTFILRATKVGTNQTVTATYSIIVRNQDEGIPTRRVPAVLNNNPLTPTPQQGDQYFDFYFSGSDLGTFRHNNYFAYKFIGYDFEANGGSIQNGVVTAVNITDPGDNYATPPNVTFTRANGDTTGTGATGRTTISAGQVTGVIITNGGYGYTLPPVVIFSPSTSGTELDRARGTSSLDSITVSNGGSGYLVAPIVTVSAPDFVGGTLAGATALVSNGVVTRIITSDPGTGYTVQPTITIAPPPPILKTVTPAVTSSNTITLSNTNNLVIGMTVVINNVSRTVTTVNTGVNVIISGAPVSIANNTQLSFVGVTAVASTLLSFQYALDGVNNINQLNTNEETQLTFNPSTGWLTGILPDIGSRIATIQLTAYTFKGTLYSTSYRYNITIQGDVNNDITWSTQDNLLGTLYNGEISYLSVSASVQGADLQYRLAPLSTNTLNDITWGAITKTASTTNDTTGFPSVLVNINPDEITNITLGATVSGGGIPTPYPTVVEIQLETNRIRLSSAQGIDLGEDLTFTTNAYVSVGDNGVIQYALLTQNTWYPANTATEGDGFSTLANFTGVVWYESLQVFVAVGNLSNRPVLFTSYDAINWFQSSQLFNNAFTSITVGYPTVDNVVTPTIVAVTRAGSIFYGTNPLSLDASGSSLTTSNLTSVTWDSYNGQFVIVSDTGVILLSQDGINWNDQIVQFPRNFGQPPGFTPTRYVRIVDQAIINSNTIRLSSTTDLVPGMTVTIDKVVHTVVTVNAGVSVVIDSPPVTLAINTTLVFYPATSYYTQATFSLKDVAATPYGYVTQIDVDTTGSGYIRAPKLTIINGGGSGASAVAVLGSGLTAGKVISVIVTAAGSGYTSAPDVIVDDTGTGGSGASAVAFTKAALAAVGTVRWQPQTGDVALLIVSTDGGAIWNAQPVFKQIPTLTQTATLESPLLSIIANPTNTDFWLIGSTDGKIIEGTHTGTTEVQGTGDPQNNVPPDETPGQWVYYTINTPYNINSLWAKPTIAPIVATPNILSCGSVGIIQESTTGEAENTWRSINVQNLPRSLTLLSSGEISGRVAFEPTDVNLAVGSKLRYEFVVQAYTTSTNPDDQLVNTTKLFNLDIVKLWDQPFETVYIKALPSNEGRSLLSSLINNNQLIPTAAVYRADDPYYGVSKSIIYQHAFGIYASSLNEYLEAELKNHYWRTIVLGELKTARALDPNGNVLYEVVYSAIQDDLVNAEGVSVSQEITWPQPINLNLGPWYDSQTKQFDSYVYAEPSTAKTTSGCTNSTVIPLNSTTGIYIGQVVSGAGVVNINGSLQRNGIQNGEGSPSVVSVNQYSVVLNKAQTIAPGTSLQFKIPFYYTSRTPGYAQNLYPDSLPNMRNRIAENLGQNTSDLILPRWMNSQQANGSTLGFVPAWVICYTKPGFSNTVKTNIENFWVDATTTKKNTLNQIDFTLDRFEVDKSATYNWDNNIIPPDWSVLPSADQTSITNQSKDFYVLFPQKTILPITPQ